MLLLLCVYVTFHCVGFPPFFVFFFASSLLIFPFLPPASASLLKTLLSLFRGEKGKGGKGTPDGLMNLSVWGGGGGRGGVSEGHAGASVHAVVSFVGCSCPGVTWALLSPRRMGFVCVISFSCARSPLLPLRHDFANPAFASPTPHLSSASPSLSFPFPSH